MLGLDRMEASERAKLASRLTLAVGALHLIAARPLLRMSYRACVRNTAFFYVGSSLALEAP